MNSKSASSAVPTPCICESARETKAYVGGTTKYVNT
jgi:hypothetical protein